MKGCDLCRGTARVYCESDEAILCFDCDARVHGANFLVARHSRVLLCRSCQSPTPWKAAGPRLGLTVSVCDGCVAGRSKNMKGSGDDDGGEDEGESREREMRIEEDDDKQEDDDETEEEEEEEEEGDEQVVPGAEEEEEEPPVASSSSSEEVESMMGRSGNGYLKRTRHNVAGLASSSSSQDYPLSRTDVDDEAITKSFRPLKDRKRADLFRSNSHQLSVDMVSFGSCRPPI